MRLTGAARKLSRETPRVCYFESGFRCVVFSWRSSNPCGFFLVFSSGTTFSASRFLHNFYERLATFPTSPLPPPLPRTLCAAELGGRADGRGGAGVRTAAARWGRARGPLGWPRGGAPFGRWFEEGGVAVVKLPPKRRLQRGAAGQPVPRACCGPRWGMMLRMPGG